jgi:PST family polysaccharide transporter
VVLRGAYRGGFVDGYLTLALGESVSKLCVLASFAYLARTLGPQNFGIVELSLSVTLIFVMAVDGGLGSFGARLVAARPTELPQMAPRIILARVVLAIPAYISVLALSASYGIPGLGVLAIYGLTVLFVPLFTQWVFQGLGQMQWVAAGVVLRNIVFALCVLIFIRSGSDVRLVAAAEILGVLALATFNWFVLKKVLHVRLDWRAVSDGAITVFKEAWPIGASQAAWGIMWYSPLLALGAVSTLQEVAWLAGPLRIVVAVHTFVYLYFFNVLPRFSKALVESVESWQMLATRSLASSIWIACLVAVSGTVLAPTIVVTFFGPEYRSSAVPLQLLIWMIPLAMLNGHFRSTLIARGEQRVEFACAAASAVLTSVMALWLGHGVGSAGSASALLIGGVFYTLLTAASVQKLVGTLRPFHLLPAPAAACLVCVIIGIGATELVGQVMATAIALLAYAAVALRHSSELGNLALHWLRR